MKLPMTSFAEFETAAKVGGADEVLESCGPEGAIFWVARRNNPA